MNITFSDNQLETIKSFAKKLELGGKSHIRSEAERSKTLAADQIVGQLGEAALHVWLTGEFEPYVATQELKNSTIQRGQGDNGRDIEGTPLTIDIKTTRIRNRYAPSKFKLIVSKPEYKSYRIYVQAFVIGPYTNPTVHIAGWAYGKGLEFLPNYKKAMGLPVVKLNPLHTLKALYQESIRDKP